MGKSINEVADYTAQIPTDVAPAAVQRAVSAFVAPALRALPGVQFVNVYGAGDEAHWIQPDIALCGVTGSRSSPWRRLSGVRSCSRLRVIRHRATAMSS